MGTSVKRSDTLDTVGEGAGRSGSGDHYDAGGGTRESRDHAKGVPGADSDV